MMSKAPKSHSLRFEIVDWLKAWAILAVILDHMEIVPEHLVIWSVNVFVLVTAAVYSIPGYAFTFKKLMSKLAYLVFIYAMGIFLIDLIFGLLHEKLDRSVLPVLLNPYFMFVKNPYLGDVWYLGLHVQILIVFYVFLKGAGRSRGEYVVLIAALISQTSFLVTHYFMDRFETIFVLSWFFYLAAGFYGMRPLLTKIRSLEQYRLFGWMIGAGILIVVYLCWPEVPWLFQNENRARGLMLPLYFGLILFLAELFYLLDGILLGRWLKQGMNFLGRYTLAVYLTHQAFLYLWDKLFDSRAFLAVLAVSSGLLFGMTVEYLFNFLRSALSRIAVEAAWGRKKGLDLVIPDEIKKGA
ncbi:MAG: acyltransferase family protein [Candidatus Omnitrophota bacterium]